MLTTAIEDVLESRGFDDEILYEMVNGQRQEHERMGAYETSLASILAWYMGPFAFGRKLGLVVTETLFILDATRGLQRRPDVAFVSYGRWPETVVPRDAAWNVVPNLAIEIISPTNLAEGIEAKIVEYFTAGVQLVWVIYPESGRVHIWKSQQHCEVLDSSGTLDGGPALPGFELPIETLFAALRKPENV